MAKLTRKKAAGKTAKDHTLLFHAMYVMAAVDGSVSPEEATVLRGIVASLPDFKTVEVDSLLRDSEGLAKKYGGTLGSIEAFTDMSDSEDLRYRAFLLATEVAYASGSINPAEEQLLSTLGRILGLEEKVCDAITSVMAFKYA